MGLNLIACCLLTIMMPSFPDGMGMISVISGWKLELIASKSSVLGGETTIQCIFDKEDTQQIFPDSLTIESKENSGNTLLVDYGFARQLLSTKPDDPRYSFNKTTSTLTISRVSCVDKKTFICKLYVSIIGSGSENQQKQFDLDIKVPPEAPDAITTTPSNLTGGVLENNPVSATCNAITGRQGKGYIEWRIYRASVAETLKKDDVRITNSVISSGSGTDPACAVRQRSILTLPSLTARDQNLVIACFVRSDDFPSSSPQNCNSPQASLCQQTETIRVLLPTTVPHSTHTTTSPDRFSPAQNSLTMTDYTANSMSQSLEVMDGESVAFFCQAKGNPRPILSIRGQRSNKILTLTDTNSGDYSKTSEITRVMRCNDTDTYTCTADNGVGGGVERSLSIFVKCIPELSSSEQNEEMKKFAFKSGVKLTIEIDVIGYPKPETYKLFIMGDRSCMNGCFVTKFALDTYKYIVTYKKGEPPEGTVVLHIFDMPDKDNGQYVLNIDNGIGDGLNYRFDVVRDSVSEPSSKKTESNTGLMVGIGVSVGCGIISSIVMFVIGMYVGKNRVHQERKSKDVTVLRPSPDYEDINEPPLQEAYLEMDSIQLQRGRPQHDLQDMGYEIPKPHRTVDNDDNPYSEYVDIDKISHHNITSHNHSNVNAHVS